MRIVSIYYLGKDFSYCDDFGGSGWRWSACGMCWGGFEYSLTRNTSWRNCWHCNCIPQDINAI